MSLRSFSLILELLEIFIRAFVSDLEWTRIDAHTKKIIHNKRSADVTSLMILMVKEQYEVITIMDVYAFFSAFIFITLLFLRIIH